ncbi:ABC transporter substrate-binding protein [Peterkaempfera bronchialis]|uniref:ABC transporter substrate-binding protein n=1 Tax=Peterkaempfera bronchialis TaxID=2126346 RepID=A0A345T0D5_9ACTN|nr:ABC transporter substrate-binding protein [Peterkaempfera bronchialis]AXI79440.1 ABC transporter substrate-binding protein [Peterkaempfera bronchialis]
MNAPPARRPRPRPRPRPRLRLRLAALATLVPLLVPLLALTACGSDGPTAAAPAAPSASEDLVSGIPKVDAIAALLPAEVRKSGVLRVGSSVGSSPPSAYYADAAQKKVVGQDIDFTDAVAKVLGLRIERQEAAFEAILPALGSGKYDLGTGNFGVTDERLRSIDFVTYIDDGQGFAVRTGNTSVGKVTDLVQLCGLTVGTGAGTTFEATLDAKKDVCAKAGRKPYQVKVFSDQAAILTGLQQGRFDVLMSTINGLRYQAAQPEAEVTFLGEFHRLDVGFAFAKGSPLTRAFQGAVNQLIKDGTYTRILRKWGTTDSAITESRINPPEHP